MSCFLILTKTTKRVLCKGHGLSADMEISMPLSLIAQNIVLRDTTAFEINMSQKLSKKAF